MMSQIRLVSKKVVGIAILLSFVIFFTIQIKKSPAHPSNFYKCSTFSTLNKQEVGDFFDKPFFYLAKGAQSVAFVSQDGKYVIKFFQINPAHQQAIFDAYRLAYDQFREESGLLYLHLDATSYLKKELVVRGKWRLRYKINLDETAFVVQERAELIYDRFKALKKEGRFSEMKKAKEAVLNLVRSRIAKNLTDDDKAVSHNYGFVGEKAIQLDIGRLHIGTRENEYEQIEEKITKNLNF